MDRKERLEQYIEGEMSAEERAAFEAEMAADPALAEEVRLFQQLETALGNREEMAVEDRLKAIMAGNAGEDEGGAEEEDDDEAGESRPRRGIIRYIWPVAAAAVLFVGLRFLLVPGTLPPGELFTEHYEAYPPPVHRSPDDSVPPKLHDAAFDAYTIGDFATADTAFRSILKIVPNNARAHFYRGICFLETDRPDSARTYFKWVVDDQKNLFLSPATWYQAMACLKIKDIPCARKQLEALSEDGKYQDAAAAVLDRL
ncbi:MAG: hypothetical protein AAF570_07485 [Bacteroidota bacterium]